MKNFTLSIFALFALAVWSCQVEEQHIVQDTTNNFSKTSPISSLISRVAQYETTSDNVLDGTSNCSIKLPAHVTVNGTYVYVGSETDFQTVQNLKDLSTTDDDKVHFGYPITLIYPNYYEHSVATEAQFESILAGYGDDSSCHEVSCLDFNYPITINLYNTNNQVANTVAVQDDTQFFNFLDDLDDSQIVSFVFPIILTNYNAQQITIGNNSQLENAINSALTTCNPGPAPSSLSDILTAGTWSISYCYYGNDYTGLYTGYNFTFNANGTSNVVKNSTHIYGDWDINNGSPQRLDLHFDGSDLHDLETNWDVQEFTSTYIRLRKSSGGSGSEQPYYLSFTKN
jgi:hypothetical protein